MKQDNKIIFNIIIITFKLIINTLIVTNHKIIIIKFKEFKIHINLINIPMMLQFQRITINIPIIIQTI
jgi:hypothetical protein